MIFFGNLSLHDSIVSPESESGFHFQLKCQRELYFTKDTIATNSLVS